VESETTEILCDFQGFCTTSEKNFPSPVPSTSIIPSITKPTASFDLNQRHYPRNETNQKLKQISFDLEKKNPFHPTISLNSKPFLIPHPIHQVFPFKLSAFPQAISFLAIF
jgi:hypothetical protein